MKSLGLYPTLKLTILKLKAGWHFQKSGAMTVCVLLVVSSLTTSMRFGNAAAGVNRGRSRLTGN